MKKEECRIKKRRLDYPTLVLFCILHFAFCIFE